MNLEGYPEHVVKYFEDIENNVGISLSLANRCRAKGLDPEDKVEVVMAKDMAERVVGLISVVAPSLKDSNIVERIKELEDKYGSQDWRVALTVALETAQEKFTKFENKIEAMEIGLRVGISYITNGVVSSPLEGFTKLEVKQRRDGGEYLALYFAGPMRSAGGTASSVSVIIGDYIRKNMGYQKYDPDEKEISRNCTELLDYHERITNLQYLPSHDEIAFMTKNLPVQVAGDGSEKIEVSNYKGLDRIDSDRIRNGVCLVMGEGLAQKAPKLWKQLARWGKDFELDDWMFIEEFVKLQKKIKSKKTEDSDDGEKLKPDHTFVKDIVAGRPVFTYPLREGGFRLRYGRARVSGFSCNAMHPATMEVLENFIAIGTQLKVERPGKSAVIAHCDAIEGPVVKLNNGSVLRLNTVEEAKAVKNDIFEIVYLGDMLISYGDFFNRGHMLIPSGYCEEWWAQELLEVVEKNGVLDDFKEIIEKIKKNYFEDVGFEESLKLSEHYKIPLHPKYSYSWKAINKERLLVLKKWVMAGNFLENKIVLQFPQDETCKRSLELIGVPHKVVSNEYIVIDGIDAKVLKYCLENLNEDKEEILDIISKEIKIKDKMGTTIGARMGRPEKAKMRKMTGSPHVLFPVGEEGGRLRSFQSSLEKGKVKNQFPIYKDANGEETIYRKINGVENEKKYFSRFGQEAKESEKDDEGIVNYKNIELDITKYFNDAVGLSGINRSMLPELIKGVRGTSNKSHVPEPLVKGLLRAKHNIYVNKDGTTRYDMTEMPLTHFKPKEIGTSIEKLKSLGYEFDVHGNELVDEDQVLELKIQDIVLPASTEALDETSDRVFLRVAQFVDDLLENVYGEKRFYNVKTTSDLVGHLVVALAPHISAGAVGRIIGFSKTQGVLAHPYFHSMVRRDCDGDELCCMLILDAMINFSRQYLPAHRGSTQDAPLVLTSLLTPSEVDDMVFDLDVVWNYPLEMYRAAEEYKMPWDIKIEQLSDRLNTPAQFFGSGYTHESNNFNDAISCSSYKLLPTMSEKVDGQMSVATKIRAVNAVDVAKLVIERHFIRDIKGNLRKFSMQMFRCVKCNAKYRRPPLVGTCTNGKCFGKIIFTISHGSIVKYLEPSLMLAEKYEVSDYLKETLDLTKLRVESIFGKASEKQEGLAKFF